MAVEERTATFYRLRCDRCGAGSEESGSRQKAILLAEDDGWKLTSSQAVCPRCLKEEEISLPTEEELAYSRIVQEGLRRRRE